MFADPTTEYVATLRRRHLKRIAQRLGAFAKVDRTSSLEVDFAADSVIKEIEKALKEIAEAEQEGNAREILRTLLNTLRNGGWAAYNTRVCSRLEAFVATLSTVKSVEPKHVAEFELLQDELGLDGFAVPLAVWPDEETHE